MEPVLKPNFLTDEAKAWLRFHDGSTIVVRIVPEGSYRLAAQSYAIYAAYVHDPDCLGRILFDASGFWIYDGEILHPDEQEQLAQFIITYVEKI